MDGDGAAGTRVCKLEEGGVEGHAVDEALGGFGLLVFPVSNDRMADGGKLHANLILQAGDQFDAQQRRGGEFAFDGIAKLGARGLGIVRGGEFLEHAVAAEIVDEGTLLGFEMAPDDGEILTDGGVGEKLADEGLAIALGLGEEKNAGGKAIDAVDHKDALLFRPEGRGEEGEGRGGASAGNGNGRQSGGLVEGDGGLILIKDGEFAGKTH